MKECCDGCLAERLFKNTKIFQSKFSHANNKNVEKSISQRIIKICFCPF